MKRGDCGAAPIAAMLLLVCAAAASAQVQAPGEALNKAAPPPVKNALLMAGSITPASLRLQTGEVATISATCQSGTPEFGYGTSPLSYTISLFRYRTSGSSGQIDVQGMKPGPGAVSLVCRQPDGSALQGASGTITIQPTTATMTPAAVTVGQAQTVTVSSTCAFGDAYIGHDQSLPIIYALVKDSYTGRTAQMTILMLYPGKTGLTTLCRVTPIGGGPVYVSDPVARLPITVTPATATLTPNPITMKVGQKLPLTATCSGGLPWIGNDPALPILYASTGNSHSTAPNVEVDTLVAKAPGQTGVIVKCRAIKDGQIKALSDVAARVPLTITP